MGKQNGWCPFGLRLQIPVSPLLWRFRSTEPNCDSDAHVIIIAHSGENTPCDSDDSAYAHVFIIAHSDAKCVALPPRPTAPRLRGAPAVVQAVHDIPKDFSTAHQVPLDNETTHQVPSVVPLGRTFVSVSCTMSRALAKTRHAKQRAPELRFATLAKTRHDPLQIRGPWYPAR
jgi:hypothetical protein